MRTRIASGVYATDMPEENSVMIELLSPHGDGCTHVVVRDKALRALERFLKRAKNAKVVGKRNP